MTADRSFATLILAAVGAGSPLPAWAADAACPAQGGQAVAVAAVEPNLDIRLSDGRLLRLVGLDAAPPAPGQGTSGGTSGDAASSKLNDLLRGHTATAQVLDTRVDRWGRLPSFVYIDDGDMHQGGIATMAIARGLGRYRAEPAAHACRATFLEAERHARTTTLGLWSETDRAMLGVDDRAAFETRSATVVVVEGRLTAVDAGPYRTKLRFAARDGSRRAVLAAVVLPRVVKSFEKQGVTFSSLIGQTIRLRGLLDVRFGPEIGVAGPDALEILLDVPSTAADAAGRG